MDPTPVTNWLQTNFGAWGYLASAVVLAACFYLKKKYGTTPTPLTPTPDASPATVSPALASATPLLDLLLKVLGKAPTGRPATIADFPHELHVQLKNEVATLDVKKLAAANAVIAELEPVFTTTSKAP